jgi:hypothetical protein
MGEMPGKINVLVLAVRKGQIMELEVAYSGTRASTIRCTVRTYVRTTC